MANSWADIFGPAGKAIVDTLSKGGPSLPPPPPFTNDPNYTAEMSFLQPYSTGLLSGNNIPAFYQSIGQQNSPQFQSALAVSNKQIGTSAAEGAAMAGTGRGGQLPQVMAQQVGDNTAALTYQDFLNSNAGKQFLMGQGQMAANTVINGSLENQGQENNYNLGAYDATIGSDKFNIGQSQAASAATGQLIGGVAGAIGGLPAGPAGATIGSQIGSNLGGSISNLFGLGGTNSTSSTPAQSAGGVSSIGSIAPDPMTNMSSDDLMQYFGLKS